jgi:parallel beta-helix repeat protein
MASLLWVDVYDRTQTTLQGTIYSAADFEYDHRLDESGAWSFAMPAGDPNAAFLVHKRVICAYTESASGPRLVGEGIIDVVELDPASDPMMLTVTGNDWLSILANYSVGQLKICTRDWQYLTLSQGSVGWERQNDGGIPYGGTYSEAFDGDVATHAHVFMRRETAGSYNYLYIGCDQRYSRIRIDLGAAVNNNATTLAGRYFKEDGTEGNLVIGTDGTASGGATMAVDGDIDFTEPTDWIRNTPTAVPGSWFWTKWYVTGANDTDTFDLNEVQVYADVPTKGGPALIIACVPGSEPAWSIVDPITGYSTTLNAAYIEFDGESVLEAFKSLAEKTGEHFALHTTGGRTVCWKRNTWASAHYQAEGVMVGQVSGALDVVPILACTERKDSTQLITYVYPYGAGTGSERAILADATRVLHTTVDATSNSGQKVLSVAVTSGFMAGGTVYINHGGARDEIGVIVSIQDGTSLTLTDNLTYTHTLAQADEVWTADYHAGYRVDKAAGAGGCIYNSVAAATYGIIEAFQTFQNVQALTPESTVQSPQMAADQLFDATLAWLKQRDSIARFYSLEIPFQGYGVYPMQRIHVTWEEYFQSYKAISINTYPSSPLYVMACTEQWVENGTFTLALEVATVDRQPDSDATVQRSQMAQTRSVSSAGAAIQVRKIASINTGSAIITGGRIDGTQIGTTTAAAGRFSSLSSGSVLDVTHPAFGARGNGETNDTAAIQAAINAASALGGAIVYLPAGTYIIPTYLSIPSNVWLRGAGSTSVIKRADAKNGSGGMNLLLGVTSATDIIISDLDVDGNGAAQDEPTGSNHNQVNIRLVSATDCIIERVYSHAAINGNIYLESCVGCTVQASMTYGATGHAGGGIGDGILLHYGSDNVIDGNICRNNANNGIVTSEGQFSTISNNACFSNGGHGIEVYSNDAAHHCVGTTVIGNSCQTNTAHGIAVTGGAAAYLVGGRIVGNVCQANTLAGIYAIATDFTFSANEIRDNGSNGFWGNQLTDCVIADNIISGNNTGDTANYAGIYLQNTCPRNQIHGNAIMNGASGLQDYAINLTAVTVTNTTIGSNSLVHGGTTAPINDAGSNTIIYSRHSVWIMPTHMHRSNANLTVDAHAAVGIWARAITTVDQTMYFTVPIIRDDNTAYHWVESLTIYYQTLSAGTEKIDSYALYRRNMGSAAIVTVLSGAGAAPGAAGLYTIVNTPGSPVVIDYVSAEKQLYLEIVVAGESTAGYLRVFGAVLVYHDMTTMYHHD